MRRHLTCLALVLLTWCTLWRVLGCDFVNYDDDRYVYANPNTLRGLTLENIAWSFGTTEFYNWHPLTWLSFAADVQVYGENPLGFHLTNLLLHTCNVLLLFAVLRTMTGASLPSAIVAALFAIHPLHVETVAWVSERKGLLSTTFGLVALWAYARYVRDDKLSWYAVSLASFAVSLTAKQMLVTFPCLLLLVDYWPLQRPKRVPTSKLLLEKLPFVAISTALSAVVFHVQQLGGTVRTLAAYPFDVRLVNAVLSYGLYLLKAVWPFGLAVHYPHPGDQIDTSAAALSALVLSAICILAVIVRRRHPYVLVGWLWFLGTLVPVIGLVQIGDQQMADRYMYVPAIGLYIAVVWTANSMLHRSRSWNLALASVTALVVLGLAATSFRQTAYWRNSVTLFEHAIDVTRNNATAHYNLANAYSHRGDNELAVEHYQATLEIRPDDARSHYSLGILAEQEGRIADAERHYRSATQCDPRYAPAHTNLAVILERQGQLEAALEHYRRAVEFAPGDPQTQFNLAVFYRFLAQRRKDSALLEQAERYARTAAAMRPADPTSNALVADILLDRRLFAEAIDQFARVLELSPDDPRVHEGLGVALVSLNRFEAAIGPLARALEIEPTPFRRQALSEAYLGGAGTAFQRRNLRQAQDYLLKLLAVDAESARGHLALGRVYLELGDHTPAARHFGIASRLDPNLKEARTMLEQLDGR